MRYTTGTLEDLTTCINAAIDELAAPVAHADGTLSSATIQLNLLIDWTGKQVAHSVGTLSSGSTQYNLLVAYYIIGTNASYLRIASLKVKPSDNDNRITVTWVGSDTIERTYTVNQRTLNRYDTAEEAKAALDVWTQNNFGYVLNDIWLHRNRDGLTWAIATGASPPDVWPEDQPIEP